MKTVDSFASIYVYISLFYEGSVACNLNGNARTKPFPRSQQSGNGFL
jgi:hypothetical protein